MEESRGSGNDDRLNPAAERLLKEIVLEYRRRLSRRAASIAGGREIKPEDIEHARSQLEFPDQAIEDAQTIITMTLRENRAIEWVAYALAFVLFVVGLVLLCSGVFRAEETSDRVASIAGGTVTETLILLPLRFAINSRRHNIAIRMLGILLDRVDDPKKLTTILKDTFLAVVVGRLPSGLQ